MQSAIPRADSESSLPNVILASSNRSPRVQHAACVGSTSEWCTEFSDSYRVRVLVLPIGSIEPEKFRSYFLLLNSFSSLELAQMTRNLDDKSRTLSSQDWYEGLFHFRFLEAKEHHKSEWEELQAHRKVFGVIGVVDCSATSDLEDAYAQFRKQAEAYPTALVNLCLAVEPRPNQPDVPRGTLVMIPQADEKRLQFYLNTLMLDFASRMLRHLESWVFDGTENQAILTTSFDYTQTADDVTRLRKRKAARLAKNKGDYCLLASAPADALNYFTEAISQSKLNSDLIWSAAALEGAAEAILLAKMPTLLTAPKFNITPDSHREVHDTFVDAIGFYNKRKVVILEVEATLKLARYLVFAGKKLDASDQLLAAHMLATNLSKSNKLALHVDITQLYSQMGFRRRSAYFLRETASLHSKAFHHTTAHYILRLACADHRLSLAFRPLVSGAASSGSLVSRQEIRGAPPFVGWPALQKQLLKGLVEVARNANDIYATCGYITLMLRQFVSVLRPNTQRKLAEYLASLTDDQPTWPRLNLLGMPHLRALHPDPLPASLAPLPTTAAQAERAIFITSPLERKKKKVEEAVWVAGEPCEVRVWLHNPMAFELPIDSISLLTEGAMFVATPSRVILPAATSAPVEVTLHGRPLAPGSVTIRGCLIRAFNLECEHLVRPDGHSLDFDRNSKALDPIAGMPTCTKVRIVPPMPRVTVRVVRGPSSPVFPDQLCELQLEVSNCGALSVDRLLLSATPSPQQNVSRSATTSAPPPLTWDEAELQRHIPLPPGARFLLTVRAVARSGCSGYNLLFKYLSSIAEDTCRQLTLQVPLELGQGLSVTAVEVLEWDGSSLPDLEIPSLSVPAALVGFEVVNSSSVALFSLVASVRNELGTFRLQPVLIGPNASRRLTLPVQCFSLPAFVPTEARPKERKASDRYVEQLAARVELSWTSLTNKSTGSLSLHAAFIHEGIAQALRPPSVSVQLAGPSATCLHEFIPLRIHVRNNTKEEQRLELRVQPFLDLENGAVELGLEDKLLWVGALQLPLPVLKENEHYEHVLPVCLLAAGTFKFTADVQHMLTREQRYCRSVLVLQGASK